MYGNTVSPLPSDRGADSGVGYLSWPGEGSLRYRGGQRHRRCHRRALEEVRGYLVQGCVKSMKLFHKSPSVPLGRKTDYYIVNCKERLELPCDAVNISEIMTKLMR